MQLVKLYVGFAISSLITIVSNNCYSESSPKTFSFQSLSSISSEITAACFLTIPIPC